MGSRLNVAVQTWETLQNTRLSALEQTFEIVLIRLVPKRGGLKIRSFTIANLFCDLLDASGGSAVVKIV